MSLCEHNYIAKHQSAYLRLLRANIGSDEMIIHINFAENYGFIIQDVLQAETKSFCIISYGLKHYTISVHVYSTILIGFLKESFPSIKQIHYFSDGAVGQYKHFKNLLNLCHHQEDFNGISAE